MFWRRLALLCTALLLGACSTTRLIDSDVRSQSFFKTTPTAGYRFERTPLQQSPEQQANQTALEAMAQAALGKVGLRRDDAHAGYSVQINARLRREWRVIGEANFLSPATAHKAHFRGGWGMGFGMRFPRQEQLIYTREVGILIRDLSNQQVVFESTAVNDSVWSDDNNILPVLFEAAISGFPTPPTGVRRVNIELPPPTT